MGFRKLHGLPISLAVIEKHHRTFCDTAQHTIFLKRGFSLRFFFLPKNELYIPNERVAVRDLLKLYIRKRTFSLRSVLAIAKSSHNGFRAIWRRFHNRGYINLISKIYKYTVDICIMAYYNLL